MARWRADSTAALLALGVAAFIAWQGVELGLGRASDPGSGFILFWTGLIMAGLSVALLVQSLVDREAVAARFAGLRWGKVVYVVALLALYSAVLEFAGFILATFVLLLVLFKTVEPQSWRVAVAGSVLTTFGAWAVFVAWLGTQLPVGSLFQVD